jgi:WD40-like Beta Propeller Repeat
MGSLLRLSIAACGLLALLAFSAPAQAAFPGKNGKIAYMTGDGHLYTINPDGSGVAEVPLPKDCVGRRGVAWTADGASLAVGNCAQMIALAPDGSGVHVVGHSSQMDSWSPDSRRLLGTGSCPITLSCLIRRYNADASGETNLTGSDWITTAEWSPDGALIAFSRTPGMFTMTPEGLDQTQIPGSIRGDMPQSWSPDGGKLLFSRPVDTDLFTINRDGSGLRQLTSDGTSGEAAWSPDGTKVAFSSFREGRYDVYVMNTDGSDQVRLTTNAGGYWVDWQPIPGPKRGDYENAAKFCKADRAFLGDAAFTKKYGANGNAANAYGKCVSQNK